MKRVLATVVAFLTLSNPCIAAEGSATSGSASSVAQEWRSAVEPLLPLGEKMAAKLVDPDDPQLRHELYRFLYSQIANAYMGLLYYDINHPDFLPYFGLAFNEAFPNPDDVYYVAQLDDKGVYKLTGYPGTVHIADFSIAGGDLIPFGRGGFGRTYANHDMKTLHVGKSGRFEVIMSPERPAGWKGDWWKLDSGATYLVLRQISYDWAKETDARVSIERLDRSAIKPRDSVASIANGMKGIPVWAENWTDFSINWIKKVRAKDLINKVAVNNYNSVGGLSTQRYIEGVFELAEDEALIVETTVPKKCRYWNFQLSDELWQSVDWVNRQSSLNGHTARLDKDRKFRAVISAADPGVPNWLDTGGLKRGLVYGRWTECDSTPTPTTRVVKLADVRKSLPADTPAVTASERDAAVRLRRQSVQLRRRW